MPHTFGRALLQRRHDVHQGSLLLSQAALSLHTLPMPNLHHHHVEG